MGIMRRRMRRRAIVGVAAAGVAYHQGKKHERHAQEYEQVQDYDQATEYAPAPPENAGPDAADLEQIGKLAQLHESGALTDEEFASAKAKLLA